MGHDVETTVREAHRRLTGEAAGVVPALFVLGAAAFVLNTLFERPVESISGLGLVAAGVPVYLWSKRK